MRRWRGPLARRSARSAPASCCPAARKPNRSGRTRLLERSLCVVTCAALLAACGGSAKPHGPPAQRVCGESAKAAARVLGHVPSQRIVSPSSVDIVCRLRSGRVTVRVEAQASSQPWVEYGTTQVHLVQAFGSGSVYKRSEIPKNVTGVGTQALWVPAQGELVTTNATESTAGSYLTVNVAHGGPSAVRLATQVARAALAVAPSGPKPGAPPS